MSGNWIDNPFWRKSFKIESSKELQLLRKCGVNRIWIDTEKGCDIAPDNADMQASEPEPDFAMHEVSARCADAICTPHGYSASDEHEDERQRAARLLAASQPILVNMFSEARMGKAINVKEVGSLVTEIASSVARNADALISLARLKNADNYTYMHSVAVCAMMISLGHCLGFSGDECRQAGMAGLLHDVGKMAVPTEILNKPDRLTESEMASVRTHTLHGHALLGHIPGIGDAAMDVALHHHEKVDGTGYPYNLKADQISVMAKMGAICDVYDAITSNRAYKAGWDPAQSIRHMANSVGHFDPTILSAFIKAIGIYPTGSCVLMKSGLLAVVVDQRSNQLLAPRVKAFFSTTRNTPVPQVLIDLERSNDKIVACANPAQWGVHIIPETHPV